MCVNRGCEQSTITKENASVQYMYCDAQNKNANKIASTSRPLVDGDIGTASIATLKLH